MKSFKDFFNRGQQLELGDRKQVKGDDLLDQEITVTDYSFMHGAHGDTAVVLYKENPDGFFFAPSILTQMLHDVDADDELKKMLHDSGMKIKIYKKSSKDGSRTYKAVDVL